MIMMQVAAYVSVFLLGMVYGAILTALYLRIRLNHRDHLDGPNS